MAHKPLTIEVLEQAEFDLTVVIDRWEEIERRLLALGHESSMEMAHEMAYDLALDIPHIAGLEFFAGLNVTDREKVLSKIELWKTARERLARLCFWLGSPSVYLVLKKVHPGFRPEVKGQDWDLKNGFDESGRKQALGVLAKLASREAEIPKVFVSYHPKDQQVLEQLRKDCAPFSENGELEIWDSSRTLPGDKAELKQVIDNAQVAVLLVSADYLNEKREWEMDPIYNRVKEGGLRLLWVPVAPSGYQTTWLEKCGPHS